jgi:PadR family transcriptional regulator PadR
MRITGQTERVLRVLLQDPGGEHYGLAVSEATGLATGTLYPILARLRKAGWLESHWEAAEVHEAEGRPRRRYYRMSGDGIESSRIALAEATARRASRRGAGQPSPRPQGAERTL